MSSKKVVIFSAPSGAGKTTLVRHLLEQGLPLEFSISACSRSPRANEQDGKDYHFLSPNRLQRKNSARCFFGVGRGVRRYVLRHLKIGSGTHLEKWQASHF